MARALPSLLFLLLGAGCLTAVEERWCDSARPCSSGFVCTNFHCLPMGSVGGGGGSVTGGGGGSVTGGGGGVTGGGGGSVTGGGGGSVTGGGGGAGCASSCDGCCLPNGACVPLPATSVVNCGARGAQCVACSVGQLCQGGLCQTVDAGVSGPGGPCTSDAQCGGDLCLTEQDGWPGGYCLRFCENTQCPTGADCVQAQTGSGEIINVCLTSCPTGNECRTQYQCDMGLCLPP